MYAYGCSIQPSQVEEEATEARRKAKDAADAVIKRAQEELQQRQDVEDQAQREVKSAQIALDEVRKQAKQEVERAEEEAQQFFSKFKTQGEHSGAQVLVYTGMQAAAHVGKHWPGMGLPHSLILLL